MNNVVEFTKPEPLVWVCACGCSTHRIYTTGAIECASCENIASVSGSGWLKELPEPTAEPREALPETKVISFSGTPRQALASMLSRVDPDGLVCLISIQENGRIRTWGGVDTKARARWLGRQLKEARALLTTFAKK